MKTTLTLATVLILGTIAWGQSQTTIHDANGRDTTVSCSGTVNTTNCTVADTTPSTWSIMKENRAQYKFCKANHIPVWDKKTHERTEECITAWQKSKEVK